MALLDLMALVYSVLQLVLDEVYSLLFPFSFNTMECPFELTDASYHPALAQLSNEHLMNHRSNADFRLVGNVTSNLTYLVLEH